nr:MAG TPA: hypothetical protein [Caudoviricetes sp.]
MENNISLFEHVIKFLSQVFDVSVEDNKIRSIKIRSEIKDCPRRYLLTGNFAQLNLFSYVYSEISNNDHDYFDSNSSSANFSKLVEESIKDAEKGSLCFAFVEDYYTVYVDGINPQDYTITDKVLKPFKPFTRKNKYGNFAVIPKDYKSGDYYPIFKHSVDGALEYRLKVMEQTNKEYGVYYIDLDKIPTELNKIYSADFVSLVYSCNEQLPMEEIEDFQKGVLSDGSDTFTSDNIAIIRINSTYEDDSQYNDFVTQCKNLVNEFKEKEPRFTDDNLVSSVRLHKFYKEQGIRKLYVTLITGLVTEDGIVEKNLSNTVAILTSMVIDEIALYEKPNSPLFISLEELTKKIIHFTNEFKDESNPLFEKVDVFNKLLKSGKVNFGAVYNCVSDYLTFNRSTVKRLGNDGKCYLLSNTYRDNASVYFVKDELILGKIYTDKDVVKLDDNKQYVVIPESLIANTLLNTNGDNSNVVSGYNYSALNAVFDKEALLDHYHDIVSEITKHDLILNRGVSLELEKIHLSDVSSDVRTNGGWGKLYKEVSGKELNESGFGTVKICDGLYGIKDGLFNIYEHSNKEYGINEF